jgi:ribosomal protein S18 acetylase RimI-like enzyme
VEHVLDNPIWNALVTGNKKISSGNEQARCLDRGIGAFAGLKDYSESDFTCLYELSPFEAPVILFTPGAIEIPKEWKTVVAKSLLQMVYQQPNPPLAENHDLVALQEKDIPAMLKLTAQTNPGPFLTRTIELGDYFGIFDGDRLVAMAGERLQPDPYTEVSAVCTHPDYLGKGYAGKLIRNQISRIMAVSRVPFLHVLPDNTRAFSLYEKLGFQTRKELMIYVIEKQAR